MVSECVGKPTYAHATEVKSVLDVRGSLVPIVAIKRASLWVIDVAEGRPIKARYHPPG